MILSAIFSVRFNVYGVTPFFPLANLAQHLPFSLYDSTKAVTFGWMGALFLFTFTLQIVSDTVTHTHTHTPAKRRQMFKRDASHPFKMASCRKSDASLSLAEAAFLWRIILTFRSMWCLSDFHLNDGDYAFFVLYTAIILQKLLPLNWDCCRNGELATLLVPNFKR